jgi:hypothetical protein
MVVHVRGVRLRVQREARQDTAAHVEVLLGDEAAQGV